MNVRDSIVIVTGASSGIGLATAKLLSQKRAKVALVARSQKVLEKLSKDLHESFVVVADMRKENDRETMVKKVIDRFGRIDILVNNAGRGYDVFVEKIDFRLFRELVELNLIAPMHLMQLVIAHMRKQGKGAIINISSGTSFLAIPNIGTYSSLKRALNGISLTAREELKDDNISVSVVYPFITATNFHKNVMGGPRKEIPQGDDIPAADSAEHVAVKILEAIEKGNAEVFAHDWMGKRR